MQKKDGQMAHGTILQDREILNNAHESAIRHAQVETTAETNVGSVTYDYLGQVNNT